MELGSNPLNAAAVATAAALDAVLDSLRYRHPFLLELQGSNGYRLLMGIGGPLGCVQNGRGDGNQPYLMAVEKIANHVTSEDEVEFLAGGTPSPIPRRQCVRFVY